jgi:rare lipoprotein A
MAACLAAGAFATSPNKHQREVGIASWYGKREAGRTAANGVAFDPRLLTAAHRRLPLGTCVRVTRLANRKFVIVPITDRGPYAPGRLIDLSEAAAVALDMKEAGLARVLVEVRPNCGEQLLVATAS